LGKNYVVNVLGSMAVGQGTLR